MPRRDFDAVAHSVFRSAVNLRLEGEERLLTLLASDEADLPQGIRIDAPKGFSFEGLAIGSRGTSRGGVLTLGDSLSVALTDAPRWDSHLSALHTDLSQPAVMDAWRVAWDALNQRKSSDSHLEGDCHLKISKAMGRILEATRQYEFADEAGIAALIGLGTGLTPSGDDVLVGYMAGLWCAAHSPEAREFLSAFGETMIRLSHRTNDISRTYLYHAARGHVSSRLFNLARAICCGADSQQVRDCTESAMRAGHTSGMETVTGFLLGLAAWELP